jgi:hypothetical protein
VYTLIRRNEHLVLSNRWDSCIVNRLVFIILFIIPNLLLAQLPPHLLNPSAEFLEQEAINHECVYIKKNDAESRLSIYPFNKASIIKIISFEDDDLSDSIRTIGKEYVMTYSAQLETITLSGSQIEDLTDILYNNFYKGEIIYLTGAGCYNPHNAILFCDQQGKAFEFIEICFHCGNFELSSSKLTLGDGCSGKIDLLKDFFQQCGIKKGLAFND